MLIYFGLSVYFILCVHSLHMIIKIQKKSVVRFLEHEFEATEGKRSTSTFWIWMENWTRQSRCVEIYVHIFIFSVGYYRPLDSGDNTYGGVREVAWTEKTVPMTAEEDVHREHVLYART